MFVGVSPVWGINENGVLPETLAVLSAMTGPFPDGRVSLINNLISGLINKGIWSDLDFLYVFAAHNRQSARVDLKTPARSAIEVDSANLTFVANRHFQGNGTSSSLDLGYNPAVNAVNYAQDSASVGIWRRDSVGIGASMGGWTDATPQGVTLIASATNFTNRINQATAANPAATGAAGLYVVNRSGATAHQSYVNGTLLSSGSVASTPVVNNNFFVGQGSATSFTQTQLFACFGGRSLDATKQKGIYDELNLYRQGVEA